MIQSLKIRNVALIEEVDVMFHSGLQVLSGETGAGKSILVDAITLILGGRADRDLIRTGSEKASIEAVFSVDENKAPHRAPRTTPITMPCYNNTTRVTL